MAITVGTIHDFYKASGSTPITTGGKTLGASTLAVVLPIVIYDASSSDGVISAVGQYNGSDYTTLAFTKVDEYYDATCDGHVSIWFLNDPEVSVSRAFRITQGGLVTHLQASFIEINGAKLEVDVVATEQSGNGSPSISWTNDEADVILIECSLTNQSLPNRLTIGAGQTQAHLKDLGADVALASYKIVSAAESQTMFWTDSDNDEYWVQVGASLKAKITTYQQACAGTLTSAGVITKKAKKAFSGVLSSAGTIVRKTSVSLSGALTSAGTVAKKMFESFTGTLTSTGTIAKKMFETLVGTLTSIGSVIGDLIDTGTLYYKSIAGTLTPTGTIAKKMFGSFAGTLTSAGNVGKKTMKALAGTLTSAGTIAKKVFMLFTGALTSAGAVSKKSMKALAGTLTSAGSISKKVLKLLAGTLTSSGSVLSELIKTYIANKVYQYRAKRIKE